jgi:glycosyltransferase involved in cell wall biosynthesis
LVLDIAEHFADNKAIHFTFVGPDPKDYPQRIFPNCNWMGSISDHGIIDELYQNMHVLLMTSSVEGFPLTIAESMAYGCIPLVTPVGEIKNMLFHEKNALFTDTEKCVEETILILNSLSTNPEQMQALSKNAYLYAKENFDSNRFNREWQSLIQSLG